METPTLTEILAEVCNIFETPYEYVIGESRKKELVVVRNIFCYVGCFYTTYSLKQIGEVLGERDHTTIIHNREKVENMFFTKDTKFLEKWEQYVSSSIIFFKLKRVGKKHAF